MVRKTWRENSQERESSILGEKMNRKKLLGVLFLITVLIYAVALYQSIQAYEEWKKVKQEEYPPEIRPYVDFDPYMVSMQGNQMILLGAIICIGWLTAITVLIRHASKN